MKSSLILLLFLFSLNLLNAQEIVQDFQSDPKSVMEEIFNAAKTKDFSNLSKLCPPTGGNDGDTQTYICDIASATKKEKKAYISYFKNARITGEIIYKQTDEGIESAQVPIWLNHPGGESRSNEFMNMAKINGKWYIISF